MQRACSIWEHERERALPQREAKWDYFGASSRETGVPVRIHALFQQSLVTQRMGAAWLTSNNTVLTFLALLPTRLATFAHRFPCLRQPSQSQPSQLPETSSPPKKRGKSSRAQARLEPAQAHLRPRPAPLPPLPPSARAQAQRPLLWGMRVMVSLAPYNDNGRKVDALLPRKITLTL